MFYVGNGPNNNFFNKLDGNKYHHDDYVIDENDSNSQFVLLSKSIANNSKILDVGCSDGKYGSYLSTKKNAVMYGIDINAEAVNQARKSNIFKDVYLMNLEITDENAPEYNRYIHTDVEFDYVILTDVLEHVSNPTTFLLNATKKLKYEGKVLISIPNIAHADIWLHLLNGEFNYTDAGILDNTHLKFFTQNSFTQWISDINCYYSDVCFDCKYLGNIHGEGDFLNNIRQEKSQLYQFISSIPNSGALQLLFALSKKKKNSKTPELDKLLSLPKKDAVDYLFKIFSESEHEIELLKQINIHLNKEITHLNKEITHLNKEITHQNASIETLTQNLEQTVETLTAIRNSRSYRLYHFFRGK